MKTKQPIEVGPVNFEKFLPTPKPKAPKPDVTFVRMKPGMTARLKELARKRRVSVNALCSAILESVLEGRGE